MVDNSRFNIWSNGHHMWWRPDAAGYTANREEAGRYTAQEAYRHAMAGAMNGSVEMGEVIVVAPYEFEDLT